MPLILGVRADVAPKDRPKPANRSGVAESDWLVIAVDRELRHAHFAMEDATKCQRKIERLDALLDDPALAATHGPDDPDRIDAIARHVALTFERERFRKEARRAAKEAALAWEKVDSEEDRIALRDGFALGWADSRIFFIATGDPLLSRLTFWTETVRVWNERPEQEATACPF